MRARSWLVITILAACGGGDGGTPDARRPDAGPPGGATARFVPPAPQAGADWGVVPYPSDLYLGEDGKLDLHALPAGPNADPAALDTLREGLATMTGAGLRSNVYFPVDLDAGAEIDPASVAGAAALVDLDDVAAGSLPGRTLWRADLGAVVFLPDLGVVLAPDHRYAAYLLDDVRTTDGVALGRDEAFADAFAAMDLHDALPAATRDHVAVATEFKTAAFVNQTRRMRDVVAAAPPAASVLDVVDGDAELDAILGDQADDAVPGQCIDNTRPQPHNHVAALVQGTIPLTSFLSDTINTDGMPEYDINGIPQVKGHFAVHYTLALPVAGDYTNLPVVLYVHGVNRTRLDFVTQINTATRAGMAMLAIDLPYHGNRATRAADQQDVANEILGTDTPDGFGDTAGLLPATQLFHLTASGGVPGRHPRAMGENLRQAAIELTELVAFLRDGDDTAIEAAIAPIAGLPDTITFRDDVGLVTESLGAMVSGVALAVEPGLGVAYLASPAGGFPDPSMLHSPNYQGTFAGAINTPFDLDARVDPTDPDRDYRVDPIVMLFGNVVERGDAIAYAPLITSGALRGGTAPDVVVGMSWGDVWVSNDTEEAYAKAMGLPVATMALAAPPDEPTRFATFVPIAWPVSANLTGGASGCFVVFHPAGHASIRKYKEQRNYEPLFPPFVPISPPTTIDPSQLQQIQELWSETFADHFDGGGPLTIEDPYADADVTASGTTCP